MGLAKKVIGVVGAGLVAAAIAGCGSGGSLLNSDQAATLSGLLKQTSAALDANHCQAANAHISSFQNSVNNLDGVNSNLTAALSTDGQTVAGLVAKKCVVTTKPTKTATTTTTQTKTKTTTTQTKTTPTHTQTTPTHTQTTPTQPVTTPQQTTTTPPSTGTGTTGGGGL
jgi:hypothetical protein